MAAPYDALVVGAGPAGSVAALVLARAGVSVALIDKAPARRDKACGDLVGPRGVQVLTELNIEIDAARRVGDMVVIGPSGRQVILPARVGRTYPGYALAVRRSRFDAELHEAACAAGAIDITGRVSALHDDGVQLACGDRVRGGLIIGADGANSTIARLASLVDEDRLLWGYAARAYVDIDVDQPLIALWNEHRHVGFPGYGWLFPGPHGANLGLGVGLGPNRQGAKRVQQQFPAFIEHLHSVGAVRAINELDRPELGGWLKMGIVGTRPARNRILLVGDAAGLVNPLQGEGIAHAMLSGRAAAAALLTTPHDPASQYRQWVRATYESWASVVTPAHASLVGHQRRIAALARLLTAPVLAPLIAPVWALYWNDLTGGATPSTAERLARDVHKLGRLLTLPSRNRRSLRRDLAGGAVDPGLR